MIQHLVVYHVGGVIIIASRSGGYFSMIILLLVNHEYGCRKRCSGCLILILKIIRYKVEVYPATYYV